MSDADFYRLKLLCACLLCLPVRALCSPLRCSGDVWNFKCPEWITLPGATAMKRQLCDSKRWWWELPALGGSFRLRSPQRAGHVHMHDAHMWAVSRETWACLSIGMSDNESLEFMARKSPSTDWRASRCLRSDRPTAKTLSINWKPSPVHWSHEKLKHSREKASGV